MATRISRAEWRWVLIAALAILAISEVPYAIGWASSGSGQVFGGFSANVLDNYTYLAKMREGAGGDWLFTIAYTTTPHEPTLLFAFYVLGGKLTAALGLPLIAGYELMFWAAALTMLLVTYWFISLYVRALPRRRLAWLLVSVSGGLNWVMLAIAGDAWLQYPAPEFVSPEGFAGLTLLYHLPHLALARAGLLAGMGVLAIAFERSSARHAVLAGALWLVTAVMVPFTVFVMAAVTGACLMALRLKRGAWPFKEVGLGMLAGVWLVPWVVYVAGVMLTNPVIAAWDSQNNVFSPPPPYYLAAYGLPLLAALPALKWALRAERRLWLLGWLAVVPVLVYLPFNSQRRLAEGVQVAIAILAAVGLARLGVAIGRHRPARRRLLPLAFLGALAPTNLLLLAGAVMLVLARPAPMFYPQDLAALADWLSTHAQRSNVLTSMETGGILPALAHVRVYVGHAPETPDFWNKQVDADRFYLAATGDDARKALLAAGHIDYVVYGPNERARAGPYRSFGPARAGYLELVFESGEWELYRVRTR